MVVVFRTSLSCVFRRSFLGRYVRRSFGVVFARLRTNFFARAAGRRVGSCDPGVGRVGWLIPVFISAPDLRLADRPLSVEAIPDQGRPTLHHRAVDFDVEGVAANGCDALVASARLDAGDPTSGKLS